MSSIGSFPLGVARGPGGEFPAAFPNPGGSPAAGISVLARFDDGRPAIESAPMGRGEHIHFAFMPGLSYARLGPKGALDGSGQSATLSNWISYPITRAQVTPPVTVSVHGVETPVLVSDKGAAVTLLNWRGSPLSNVGLVLRLPFKVGSVDSLAHGRLDFIQTPEGVTIHVPLKAVDVLMVRPAN